MAVQLRAPPSTLDSIAAQEASCVFPHFTAETAWTLGNIIRTKLLSLTKTTGRSAVISISLANANQPLFFTAVGSGTLPDNDFWVARKRKVVLRWGCSTWAFRHKMLAKNPDGDVEETLKKFFVLGDSAGEYAIHGGGFPIKVRKVEGVVGVIVVSGLTMEQDHQVIVESIEEYLKGVESGQYAE
ncbi:DUF967 domain protein [Gloeophyllum trabeum ATCC 11539]|uniref:DUF967 domain protein n=1 Tax=Gloeophyllum trabeum (strain ATCC 11539 / FP-39264 / Madison 617) TaxID=670483 RepID=S7QJ14_GLOTA|nr:DUF967 domain protein [Gloeophyllum trabeum ATCC 11539]EPQ59362.1 DUF967 domain protein [Gloeophyllum trabeum ATCC 11539]